MSKLVEGIKKFFSFSSSPILRKMGVIGASSSLIGQEWNFLEEANKNARLQSPIHCCAIDFAANEWWLGQRNKDLDFEPHTPTTGSSAEMLWNLWENPCPKLSRLDLFYWSQGCLDTIGRYFWRLKDMDEYGRPREIWPLPPHWVIEEPCAQNGFRFYTEWWTSEEPIWIPAAEIFDQIRPSWQAPLTGAIGLAQSMDDEIAQDKAMAQYNTMYFENFACLGAIIGVPGYADDEDAIDDKIKRARVGAHNAFKTMVFDSTGGNVTATNLSPSLKDLAFSEGRKTSRDFFLQAFQVPAARAGTIDKAKRDDIEAADFAQSKYNTLPRLTTFSQNIDNKLTALFDNRNMRIPSHTRRRIGRLKLVFVNPVRKTTKDLLEETKEGVRMCWMTRNEARIRHGLKPKPNGDVYLVLKNNMAFIPEDADVNDFVFDNDDMESENDGEDISEESDN